MLVVAMLMFALVVVVRILVRETFIARAGIAAGQARTAVAIPRRAILVALRQAGETRLELADIGPAAVVFLAGAISPGRDAGHPAIGTGVIRHPDATRTTGQQSRHASTGPTVRARRRGRPRARARVHVSKRSPSITLPPHAETLTTLVIEP